ncbi:ribonuclease P protein component [Aliigemmobacter aestuarii]|uniref:Ribonuclease P protein component n=1 Tax=Aliigemmobacter aestuarii TaxID=1445661 RepID=A0A4S3MST2_9RHOB|nr:ribonuclease P protein component [Gemmobacter aestuarii]THD85194.1 ribonuclease P protein component [Gemmobacter aestuarii]
MTPPEAQGAGRHAGAPEAPPAVSLSPTSGPRLTVIARRADFLRAAQARRQGTPGFLLQARERKDDSPAVRVGFTCSKKIGNSVARNRARRRLREVARAVLPAMGRPGWDYVLVGRPGATIERDFALLLGDLRTALGQIHAARSPKPSEGLA